MDELVRSRNNTEKVHVYCCGKPMKDIGYWPAAMPAKDGEAVVRKFVCEICNNFADVRAPFKQTKVSTWEIISV